MGEMRILNDHGDETILWDPTDKESVTKAYRLYEKLKKDGFQFYEVEETKGKKLKRFDKRLGRILAAPGGRTEADKKAGTRPRAMAGGPTARASAVRW